MPRNPTLARDPLMGGLLLYGERNGLRPGEPSEPRPATLEDLSAEAVETIRDRLCGGDARLAVQVLRLAIDKGPTEPSDAWPELDREPQTIEEARRILEAAEGTRK